MCDVNGRVIPWPFSHLGYRPLQDLSHSPWLIFKFSLLKNKIISWRGWRLRCTSRCHFSCRPTVVPFFFLLLYLSLDLFFGACSALYIMVAGLGQLKGRSCRRGRPQCVDTLRYTSKAPMNNLALPQRQNGLCRDTEPLLWLTYGHSLSVKGAWAKCLKRKHGVDIIGSTIFHFPIYSKSTAHGMLSRQRLNFSV